MTKIYCPKKSKVCSSVICYMTPRKNYICCGISTKPTKCKDDKIWLCLKSKYCTRGLEMTAEEALSIVSALSLGLNALSQNIMKASFNEKS